MALTRHRLENFDLAIVPESAFVPCGIERDDRVHGVTPDSEVNEWRLDLVQLTVAKLAKLASAIRSEGKITRY